MFENDDKSIGDNFKDVEKGFIKELDVMVSPLYPQNPIELIIPYSIMATYKIVNRSGYVQSLHPVIWILLLGDHFYKLQILFRKINRKINLERS